MHRLAHTAITRVRRGEARVVLGQQPVELLAEAGRDGHTVLHVVTRSAPGSGVSRTRAFNRLLISGCGQ